MKHWIIAATILTLCALAAAETLPQLDDKPKLPRSQDPSWLGMIDRLRRHPRPGEINHGGVNCNIMDLYTMTPEQRPNVIKILDDYDAAILAQAAKWEEDIKKLRAEYEAKLLQTVAEEKREPAKKLLEYSHTNWVSEMDRETKFKQEFMERSRKAARNGTPEELRDMKIMMQTWMREWRTRTAEKEKEVLQTIRAMLTPEEAARMEKYDRNRPIEEEGPKEEPKK